MRTLDGCRQCNGDGYSLSPDPIPGDKWGEHKVLRCEACNPYPMSWPEPGRTPAQATAALRQLRALVDERFTVERAARIVSAPDWRQGSKSDASFDGDRALAQLVVWALETRAAGLAPHQCHVATVGMGGTRIMALVMSRAEEGRGA